MTILKKSLAVLLAVALLLGTVSVAASAEFNYANDDGNSLTLTLKFFRKDAESGEWIETTRAKPGEELQMYLYAATDYYTGLIDVGFAFDKSYFALDDHSAGDSVSDISTFNASYMGDALQIEDYQPTWWPETSGTIRRGLRVEKITQDEADKNGFISGSLMQTAGTRNQMLTDSEWLLRFDEIKVLDNDYVKTPGQEGVAYVPEKFAITTGADSSGGVYSFPKGPDEAGVEHSAASLKVSGDGWNVNTTSNPAVISVFSNMVLDANGGAFVGADSTATKTLSGVIGEQVTGIDSSIPRKENSTFLGWSLEPNGEVLTAAEKANLFYDYEDQTLYAQWQATDDGENSYLIKRYYMDTNGDYPTEPDVETIENVSFGTYPVSTATTEGFVLDETQPNVTTAVVSESVTTDAVLYFARSPYTLNYHYTDSNGAQIDGYEGILYGAPLPEFQGNNGNPVREGYEFKGWALTEGDESTIVNTSTMTMPAKDLDLYAIEELATYTYVFDAGEGKFESNGEPLLTYEYQYNDTPEEAEAPVREGYDFIGWDKDLPDQVTGDEEFTAIYSPIEYTLTWLDADGEQIDQGKFYFEDEIDSSFVPEGYKEDAWINTADNTTVTFPFSMPAEDVTLQAAEDAATYKAFFMVDDEEYDVTENVVDSDIKLPDENPTKEGHTFLMWDPEPGIQEAEDMYFDAVFEINDCTLIYDPNGGEFEAIPNGFEADPDGRISTTAEFGADVAVPGDPVREGWVFAGWDKETPTTMPAGEETMIADEPAHITVITAQWRAEQHTLTFDANGGEYADGSEKITITDYTDADITDRTPTDDPTRDGYVFNGYAPALNNDEMPTTMPGTDKTYVAQWDPEQHTVTFDPTGGEADYDGTPATIDDIVGYTDDPINMPPDPVWEGHEFEGWFDVDSGDGPVDLDKIPAKDTDLIAQWSTTEFNAYFNANGGHFGDDETDTLKVVPTAYGDTIQKPDDPVRDGYDFDGWDPVPAEMPNSDITFNAKWTPSATGEAAYIINIYLENPAEPGTYLDPTQQTGTVVDGETIEITDGTSDADVVISYEGLNDSPANEPDPDNANNTLAITAVEGAENVLNAYFKLKTFTVNFDENDGEIEEGSNEVIGYYGDELKAPTVSREGYNLKGWQNDDTGEIEEVPATITEDASYTAQWEKKTNTVTFNINGEEYKTETFEYGDPIVPPTYTAPDGYTFPGWDIPDGKTMGDEPQTYDATLVPIDYTLSYVVTGDVPSGFSTPTTQEGLHVGDTPTLADVTVPEGYTFNGWKIENVTYDPGTDYTMPAKNVVASGSFTAQEFLIDFDTDGGNYVPHEKHKVGDDIIADNLPSTSKEGFNFLYWEDEDGNEVTDFTMPAKDITLKAVYEEIPTYTVTFDLDGGNIDGNTTNPTQTGPAGDPITQPADPVKEHYTFGGWDPAVDATIPDGGATYTAQWTEDPTYTVTFDLDGGNIGGDTTNPTQTGYVGDPITTPADPTKDGFNFAGWDPAVDATIPDGGATYTAQWTTVPTYTVTFDLDGGNIDGNTENPTQTGPAGDPITKPADPTKDGFTFAGWDPAVDATIPEGGKTYTAKWTPVPTYTVTFYLNGGNIDGNTTNPTQTGPAGDPITQPADPVRDGYTFGGWDPAVDATIPEGNKTYVAQWTPIPTYTVTFDLNGGNIDGSTVSPTQTGKAGDPLTKPADPTRDGYTFAGWDPAVDATIPEGGQTYTAQWTPIPTYTVTFDLDGGNIDGDTTNPTQTGYAGDPITTPADPTKDGFNFAGWDPTVDATIPEGGATYTAQWTTIPTYTVTFDLDGGNIDGNTENPTQTGPAGDPITKPADPTKDGFTFTGWDPAVDATIPEGGKTYVAQWEENAPATHTVTYYLADGDDTPYQTDTYAEGETITPAADPTSEGFTFDGWVDKDGNALPSTMGTDDITVFAKWTPKTYTVTYINEGEVYQTYPDVLFGAEVPKPADPTSSDPAKTFAGWDKSIPATMPAEDLTFTATYITAEPGEYTATYIVDGNTYKAYTVKEGDPVPVPEAPEKFAFRFKGWTPEVPDTMPAEDLVFEAEWELDPTFVAVVVGGTVIGGAAIAGIIGTNTALITGAAIVGGVLVITLAKHTHTVKYLVDGELYRFYIVLEGTKIPVPKDPTKDGATFEGWTPDVPEKMPANDLTFEATWDTDEKPASDDTDVKIPDTGSVAGIAAFTAISGAAAAAFLYMKKKRDED
ncbi:MAG: InlB B-repeat-containing protein [Clostridia bacterium]|nr:InlB B-repeat-containing protein [Clostridia bacterium]